MVLVGSPRLLLIKCFYHELQGEMDDQKEIQQMWKEDDLFKKYEAGGVAQVVECLPSKHEDLSLHPKTAKKS
jgi:hypothetical protein